MQQEDLYHALLETQSDLGEGLVAAEGQHIVYVNDALCRIAGCSAPDLKRWQDVLALIVQQERSTVSTWLQDCLSGESAEAHCEATILRSDGRRVAVELTLRSVRADDSDLAVGIVRDITHRKRTEEALKRSAEEQAALCAVTSAAVTSLDLDRLLATVLDVVLHIMGCDGGWIILPRPTAGASPRSFVRRSIPEALLTDNASLFAFACPLCPRVLEGVDADAATGLILQCPGLPAKTLVSANLHSPMCVPLTMSGDASGILSVFWHMPRRYSEPDHALLTTMGWQIGLALRNALLHQDALQVDRLRALSELDQALTATLDPEKAAEVTLSQIAAILDAPMGALLVLSPRDEGHPEGVLTLGDGWTKRALPEKDLQSWRALLRQLRGSRQPVLLSDDALARFGSGEHWHPDIGRAASRLAVPVWGEEELVAVLILGGRPSDRPFLRGDRALAQAAAGRAGHAIQHARLYEASRRQSARLAILNEISAAAVSSLELDTMLRQVLGLTCDALDAVEGSILLKDQDTGELFFALTMRDGEDTLRGWRLALGQGIAGWVALHGESVSTNDVSRDPRWYGGVDEAIGFETGTLICVPLRHQGQITGVIEIVNKRQGGFTDEDLDLLEAVSSIAAAAFENAQLYAVTRSYADELAMLLETGLMLTSTVDSSTVVRAALSQVQRLFHAEYVALLQPDPGTGELCFNQALVGAYPVEIPMRLRPDEGIAGWALESGKPVLVQDVQTDPGWSASINQFLDFKTRAAMVVPLLTAERAIGVLEVASDEPGVYTRREIRTLQAFASTLAVALENAGLYDELKTLLREREEAQARLIHSEKMTALGQLVASIAHEISNPFQAMQTYLTLACEELESGQRRDKLERYLRTIGDEIERIATILRSLREFYRPAREEWQPTDLHAVLESVLELTRRQLQHSDVTVIRQWVGESNKIEARPDHLKQVFLNLVLNAIDAMPEGGELHVCTASDQMEAADSGRVVPAARIEFSDTGVGMSPTALSHVFEPFFTTKAHGSGLGLSTSYGIIQSHNGQITATSQIGLGTTFTILLPVVQSKNAGSDQ